MRVLLFLLLIPVFTPSIANESPQALQDAFIAAVKANDADAVAACYTNEATNYGIGVMIEKGKDAIRKSWQDFFSANKVLDIALLDGHMEILGEAAVAWGLFRMSIAPVGGGEPVEMRGRYTDVSKKVAGQWLYVFDHASVPAAKSQE